MTMAVFPENPAFTTAIPRFENRYFLLTKPSLLYIIRVLQPRDPKKNGNKNQ